MQDLNQRMRDFFGGGIGQPPRHRQRVPVIDLTIDLDLVDTGGTRRAKVPIESPCEGCAGLGGEPCQACNGTGMMYATRGTMTFGTTCQRCHGQGIEPTKVCGSCKGSGKHVKHVEAIVNVPPGIAPGQAIRMSHKNGEVVVRIHVDMPAGFERHGSDLYTIRRVSLPDAMMGGNVKIDLPGKRTETVNVPAGCQSGQEVQVQNAGLPNLKLPALRGTLHVQFEVQVPAANSKRLQKIARDLRKALEGAK